MTTLADILHDIILESDKRCKSWLWHITRFSDEPSIQLFATNDLPLGVDIPSCLGAAPSCGFLPIHLLENDPQIISQVRLANDIFPSTELRGPSFMTTSVKALVCRWHNRVAAIRLGLTK